MHPPAIVPSVPWSAKTARSLTPTWQVAWAAVAPLALAQLGQGQRGLRGAAVLEKQTRQGFAVVLK